MAFYQKLSQENDEVRMLTIVDPPDGRHSDLVHCKLEHVSLKEFTPQFTDFVKELGEYKALQKWISSTKHDNGQLNSLGPFGASLRIPLWRWKMHYGSEEDALRGWVELLEAMNIDRHECPKIPKQPRNIFLPNLYSSLRVPIKSRHIPLKPRFNWGDFEAISYCWESDKRDKEIVVDGHLFKVPTNLEALLQKLRKLPETNSGMKYWVDALCINQDDTSERNHQVKLMKLIYSRAFAVIVWLGEFMEGSKEAIDFIASITQFAFSDQRDKGSDLEEWAEAQTGVDQEKSLSELPWKSLLLFFTREYWHRLWIIQELALNHNMTLFLCGDRQLSRSMLKRTCNFYERLIDLVDRVTPPMPEIEDHTRSATGVFGLRYITSINYFIQPMGQDSRDKVYGLLGLLPDTLSTTMNPNYTDSNLKQDVYQQFAVAQLQMSRRLDSILSWCSYKSSSSLPSWVPDWSSPFSRNRVQWLKRYKAGGTVPYEWEVVPASRSLRVRGIIFDSVSAISAAKSESLSFDEVLSDPHVEVSNELLYHRYGQNNLSAALRRTLLIPNHPHHSLRAHNFSIFDIYWTHWKSGASSYENNERDMILYGMQIITKNLCWKTFDQFRHTNAEFSIFGKSFRSFFSTMDTPGGFQLAPESSVSEEDLSKQSTSPIQSTRKELTNYHVSEMLTTVIALIGRRLITTKGGYLGLVPEETQLGDVIAVLYGCNFPVVLRPVGGLYQVIGESYVDGVMNGEVIHARDRGEYKEVGITLC